MDKAKVAKDVAVAKAKAAAEAVVPAVKKGWKWLKDKIDEKRNGGGLPLADAPKA